MCDRVAIIREGELVYEGSLAGIAEERVMLEIEAEPYERAREMFRALKGVEEGNRVIFPVGTDPSLVARRLVEAGIELRKLNPVQRSLEDVYLEATGRQGAGGSGS